MEHKLVDQSLLQVFEVIHQRELSILDFRWCDDKQQCVVKAEEYAISICGIEKGQSCITLTEKMFGLQWVTTSSRHF